MLYFFWGISYLMLRIYLVTRHYGYVATICSYIINFNKFLWNYEFIIMKIYFHWKSDLLMKFLYYENLAPYGSRCYWWHFKIWHYSKMMQLIF